MTMKGWRVGLVLGLAVGTLSCLVTMETSDHDENTEWDAEEEQAIGTDEMDAAEPLGRFTATHYPYGNESWPHTTCGSTNYNRGNFFAVTDKSPFYPQRCQDHLVECTATCQEIWDRIPWHMDGHVIKKEENGKRLVNEPWCPGLPCGRKFILKRGSRARKARLWDACPKYHWNNVSKQDNPCAKANHVDLWIKLHERLGGEDGMVEIFRP